LSISSTTVAVIVICSPNVTGPVVVISTWVGILFTVNVVVFVWPFATFSIPSNDAVNVNVPFGACATNVVVNVPSGLVVASAIVYSSAAKCTVCPPSFVPFVSVRLPVIVNMPLIYCLFGVTVTFIMVSASSISSPAIVVWLLIGLKSSFPA